MKPFIQGKKSKYPANPFNLGSFAYGDGFFNRQDELKKIDLFINSTPHAYHLLIIGQRRIGKTSLLRKIQDSSDKHIHTIYFDLQDKARTPFNQLLYDLAKKTALDIGITLMYKKELVSKPDFFINTFIKNFVKNYKKADTLLFLFDEFDVLGIQGDIEDDSHRSKPQPNSRCEFDLEYYLTKGASSQ